jgi:hypothetical protein
LLPSLTPCFCFFAKGGLGGSVGLLARAGLGGGIGLSARGRLGVALADVKKV